MCAAASAVPPWRSPKGPGLPGGVSVYSPRPVPSPCCPTHGGSPTGPPSHPESQQMAPCARRWRRPEPGTGGGGKPGGDREGPGKGCTGQRWDVLVHAGLGRSMLGCAGPFWAVLGCALLSWSMQDHAGLCWEELDCIGLGGAGS